MLESRATISLVPSVALVCLTVGVLVHDSLMRRIHVAVLTCGVLAMAGSGHLMFWYLPTYPGLLIGYGVVFGFSAGIGFGLALALARATTSPPRGWIVGLVAATFAASGMSVSAVGGMLGTVEPVPRVFGLLGLAFLVAAAAAGLLLRRSSFPSTGRGPSVNVRAEVRSLGFWCLFFGNFAICYAGLMFISHGSALLSELGPPKVNPSWAPFMSNIGYVFGALLGGVAVAHLPGRMTPLIFSLISVLSGLTFIFQDLNFLQLPALFLIGAAFGSTVPSFMMLFTIWFGTGKAGVMFGRLNIGYGIAGFAAPAVTGWLFTYRGGYELPVLTCIGLLVAGSISIAVSPKPT